VIETKDFSIYKYASIYYNFTLNEKSNIRAIEYLESRGFSDRKFLNKFNVGFSGKRAGLIDFLDKEGFSREQRLDSKLTKLSSEDKEYEVFGQNRIIFPVLSSDKVVHFSSRSIDDSEPKHKHLSKPNKFLYNDSAIAEAITHINLVEGILDCLSMIRLGNENTVATFGTGGFKQSFCSYFTNKNLGVYIIFDNDSNGSGKKGAIRTAVTLARNGINNIKIVDLGRNPEEKKRDCNSISLYANANILIASAKINARDPYDFQEFRDLINPKQKEFVDNVYDSFKIMDVIEKHTTVRYNTSNRASAICPLHEDTNASLIIYKQTNSWFCFGCNTGGGPYHFLKKMGLLEGGDHNVCSRTIKML